MNITESTAKTLLRKQKQIDSWFCSAYGMNIYRGCAHNCTYCDGRAEKYRVEGDFGNNITVKMNAAELAGRELNPDRKRKPMKNGFLFIGGGVNDAYQPAEKQYGITRRVLETVSEYSRPVHILTKSDLVLRDADVLEKINKDTKAVVSFSLSSVDVELSAYFEPGASPPSARLNALSTLKRRGFTCGIYLMPILPFISDTPRHLNSIYSMAGEAGADFIIPGPLTLKPGRQKEYFYRSLEGFDPGLLHQYDIIYTSDPWGNPVREYSEMLGSVLSAVQNRYHIAGRIPPEVFGPVLDENDRIYVILDHIDFFYRSRGFRSPYGYAARSILNRTEPLGLNRRKLRQIPGVGPGIEKIIREILDTGTCGLYQRLLYGYNPGMQKFEDG